MSPEINDTSIEGRLPYGDGDWFAVPLRKGGGYGVGVVARHDRRGGVIGYLFSVRSDGVPSLDDVVGLRPADAIKVMRFGDLGLIKGQWPILGKLEDWRPEEWPLPVFGRREPTGRAFRVIYEDGRPSRPGARGADLRRGV